MFWSVISLTCGFLNICKEFCMEKWMKFKLKLGFLVLARVKGKTSQQSHVTWLAFFRAAKLCPKLQSLYLAFWDGGAKYSPEKKSLRMSLNGEICNNKNWLQMRLQHRSGELFWHQLSPRTWYIAFLTIICIS
jgi:hypothetical protein